MTSKPKGALAQVYSDGPAIDPAAHYDQWAETYDKDLLQTYGYRAPSFGATGLASVLEDKQARIVDVGCGTGLVGAALAELGFQKIDGVDISENMLAKAKETNAYHTLILQDVEKASVIDEATYDAVISVGAFGKGHLGPEAIPGLIAHAKPGAPVVIFMNADPFVEDNYQRHFDQWEMARLWSVLRIEDHNYMDALERPGKLVIARRAVHRTVESQKQATARYLRALGHDLKARAETAPTLLPFADDLLAATLEGPTRGPHDDTPHPTLALLPRTVRTITAPEPLKDAVAKAASVLDWKQVFDDAGGGIDRDLAAGMFAAQALGTYGVFDSTSIAVGIFLLAPNIAYPLHTHEAEEIYYVISGSLTLQHGVEGQRFTVSAGEVSRTPPHRLHGLETGDEPVLVLYAWRGDIMCKNWWWDRDENGSLRRTSWFRGHGKAWKIEASEQVTDAVYAEAHKDL